MAHDVFISYASTDKAVADAVCAALEADHIRCYIAPRDVLTGQSFAKALVDAIHAARVLVIVFSAASNSSQQVEREVDRAVSCGLPILPLRVEDAMPSTTLEYYLAGQHWIDAITPPLEGHLARLSEAVSALLDVSPELPGAAASAAAPAAAPPPLAAPAPAAAPAAAATYRPAAGTATDRVHFTVASPPTVVPGESFVVDVWAHLREERDEVLDCVRRAVGDSAVTKETAGLHIARDSDLVVTLDIDGLTVDEPCGVIFWDGGMANADFIVSVPAAAPLGRRTGTVTITVEGLRLTRIRFMFAVVAEAEERRLHSVVKSGYESAFASYASDDRNLVLGRIQGMQKVTPLDIFLDTESLRSGQHRESQLWEEVENRDVFFLFWSRAAAASDWVEKEWRYALERRGLGFIDPVPLEPPDVAPPPPKELSELHFNDKWLAFMRTAPGSAR